MADVPMFLRILSPISNLAGGGSKKDGKRTSNAKPVAYKRGGKVKKAKRGGRKMKGR